MGQSDQNSLGEKHFHQLPEAPAFAGRERELQTLQQFWTKGHGVVSLIGIGGAGKTACTQKFLEWVRTQSPAEGLLVWSFYDDPDANQFLRSAYEFFTGDTNAKASGAGWFSLLAEVLSSGKKYLLVLDGLERIQRQQTDASGIYGELEDALLKGLLVRVCTGAGNTKAIITSRFPVSSLERWSGKGYEVIDIDVLDVHAAKSLVRSHGVTGTEEQVETLIEAASGHALTTDLLAGAVARFFGGEAGSMPEINVRKSEENHQALRLSAVLKIFEDNLSERQIDLIKCLCVFRFGVTREAIQRVFVGSDKASISGSLAEATTEEIEADLKSLVDCHLVYYEVTGRYTVHPTVRDYFYRLFRDPKVVHSAVKEHLAGLTARPGIGLPIDKPSLDLLEDLVFHALKAGSEDYAADIYFSRLGGSDHLNTVLGEYVRTHRILSAFETCPDKTGMYHCLRAFGEFAEALEWRPTNRYIELLSGRLAQLADDASPATSAVARALLGDDVRLPDRTPDFPIPSSLVYLLKGDLAEAERVARLEMKVSVYSDDVVRNGIVLAEVLRRRGDLRRARQTMDEAAEWSLHSGSQEHLCLLHLFRARLELDEGEAERAQRSLEEGLRTAEDCEFTLFTVLLLADLSRLKLRIGQDKESAALLEKAHDIANSKETGLPRNLYSSQILGHR